MDNQKLDKMLNKLCKRSKVVGVNVALFSDKEILYHYNYGYANKEERIRSDNDSLYMIGSNTKVMTALGILKLWENGVLSLDDDIRKFIPEFEVKSNFEYDKITIEHLLMHRSGLVSDLFHLILDSTRDYHEVIEELKDTYLTAVPGQMFSYSNVGYTVLGIVIERASGLSYTEYIQEVIAKPLGIQIHFFLNAQERKPYATHVSLCYDKKGKAVEELISTLLPAGSNVYMSLTDFVKFGQIFLNKDHTIFKKETLELMETLNVKESFEARLQNVGYGLIHNQYDFGKKVGKVLGHGGDTNYHHSVFHYIPHRNVGIVVMTNSEQAVKLSRMLGENILTEYLKEKGLVGEKLSVKHKHVQRKDKPCIGRFATSSGVFDVQLNRKNEPVTKVSGIPVKLLACEDGYWQCYPIYPIHKLPPFKRAIQGIRITLTSYCCEEIVVAEETERYHRTGGIIGSRYEPTIIPETFREACGSYRITNEKFRNLRCKCSLKQKDNMLILEIEALNTKSSCCLKVLDENRAIIQGFGRSARETVKLQKSKEGIYLMYSGIVFKKM